MFRLSILLFFITFLSFSQRVDKLEFSISEIDSLCDFESCFNLSHFNSTKIEIKRETLDFNTNSKTIVNGSGTSSWSFNGFFTDSIHYKTLSRKEQKFYDSKKRCKLIRAKYLKGVSFEDGSSEKEEIFLYFNDNELIYIKYRNCFIDKNKIENPTYHNFFFSNIEYELANDISLKEDLIKKKIEIKEMWLKYGS